ncbi:urease accessory protein UreF [Propioniciclava soli]|uniref:Urease accessory protein UreF n=1 Tax=Propioniciclava soli TaxID=2775081 RepID=A0ABZ3C7I4_9ACTN|nr:urease accessory protein UreF [Propioniciclava soli]
MQSTPTDASHAPSDALPAYLLPLLQFADSALPTGAFSHSFGLETYVSEGVVTDTDTCAAWLDAYVREQLTPTDALAAHLVMTAPDLTTIWRVDDLLRAQALPRQVREASAHLGRRTVAIAAANHPSPWLCAYAERIEAGLAAGHPAVATALVGRGLGAPASTVVALVLHAAVTSLTQNAVRAIPLGADAGQRILAHVQPRIAEAVATAATLPIEALGAVAPGLEIAQMRHERQRARMFMS